MDQQAPQRKYVPRTVRAGPWYLLFSDFRPGRGSANLPALEQANRSKAMINGLHSTLRMAQGKTGQPNAMVLDDTLQSTCENGSRDGYGGYKRK